MLYITASQGYLITINYNQLVFWGVTHHPLCTWEFWLTLRFWIRGFKSAARQVFFYKTNLDKKIQRFFLTNFFLLWTHCLHATFHCAVFFFLYQVHSVCVHQKIRLFLVKCDCLLHFKVARRKLGILVLAHPPPRGIRLGVVLGGGLQTRSL